MQISQLFKQKRTVFSLEIFPPKPTSPIESVYKTLDGLSVLSPDYISVTYSAGGSGNSRTAEISGIVKNNFSIEPLAHLTCINSTKQQISAELERLKKSGIHNILALRGDKTTEQNTGDFTYASDLIEFIKQTGGFDVAAACYPEGHIDSPTINDDIKNLKKKELAGASHFISQLFFDNEDFYSFLDKCSLADINVPIQAGIMPLVKKTQVERILTLTGSKIPKKLSRLLARFSDDEKSLMDAGISYATDQIIDLLSYGVSGIHLYVMNNTYVGERIINNTKEVLKSINASV